MRAFYWLRVKFKMFLRRVRCIDSFCRHCGRDVRDFHVDEETWWRVSPHIRNANGAPDGGIVCYDCFCDLCAKIGLPPVWRLSPVDSKVCELVFLRSGDLPPGGRSCNYHTNELEVGVSVYEGIIRDGKAYVLLPRATPGAAEGLDMLPERPCYLVTGDVVGTGGDGEKCLANVQIVRRVELYGAEPKETDQFAVERPEPEHKVNTCYSVAGTDENVKSCTCGWKVTCTDMNEAHYLYDQHLKFHSK